MADSDGDESLSSLDSNASWLRSPDASDEDGDRSDSCDEDEERAAGMRDAGAGGSGQDGGSGEEGGSGGSSEDDMPSGDEDGAELLLPHSSGAALLEGRGAPLPAAAGDTAAAAEMVLHQGPPQAGRNQPLATATAIPRAAEPAERNDLPAHAALDRPLAPPALHQPLASMQSPDMKLGKVVCHPVSGNVGTLTHLSPGRTHGTLQTQRFSARGLGVDTTKYNVDPLGGGARRPLQQDPGARQPVIVTRGVDVFKVGPVTGHKGSPAANVSFRAAGGVGERRVKTSMLHALLPGELLSRAVHPAARDALAAALTADGPAGGTGAALLLLGEPAPAAATVHDFYAAS